MERAATAGRAAGPDERTRAASPRRWAARAAFAVAGAAIVVALWFGSTALILLQVETAPSVTAVFLREAGRAVLPPSVSILEWDGHVGRFVGRAPGYVGDLYAAGALIVLPGDMAGCVAEQRDRTPAPPS